MATGKYASLHKFSSFISVVIAIAFGLCSYSYFYMLITDQNPTGTSYIFFVIYYIVFNFFTNLTLFNYHKLPKEKKISVYDSIKNCVERTAYFYSYYMFIVLALLMPLAFDVSYIYLFLSFLIALNKIYEVWKMHKILKMNDDPEDY